MLYNLIKWFNKPDFTLLLNYDEGYYFIAGESDQEIRILGDFFTCDVGSTVDHWINFLNDPEWPETQSNWCVLEKDGDEVRIFDFLTEERAQPYPVPEDQVLRIKNSELQKLLYQWQDILSRDSLPSTIKITEKRGVFKLEVID